MARGMDYRKPRLGEYAAPWSLCLCQYPPEVSQCSRISVSLGEGLHFISVMKMRWKLQLVGFLYDRKSANAVQKINGDTFWPSNRTVNAQKNGQGEPARR